MFAINRLILIDSYKAHQSQELRLNGHTNLNGVNGAGKTTLLRLLPLFFGASPRSLVLKSRVTDSFVKHYLPRESSYIIFEYQRNNKTCMVVIYARNEDGVCYRFIDKHFDMADFTETHSDGSVVPISCLHLKKYFHSSPHRVHLSDQLNTSEYRSVIQNTGTKKELRDLSARYSFGIGSAGQRLKDMEKIVSGMLNRFTDFTELRAMLVSCIDEQRDTIELGVNPDTLTTWHKEYRAFEKVEKERPKAALLTQLSHDLAQTTDNLAQLQQRLRLLSERTQQQEQTHQKNLKELGQQSERLREQWQDNEQAIRSSLAQTKADLNQYERDKNRLEQEQTNWQQRDINKRQLLASRLMDIKTQLTLETETQQRFLAATQDIEAEFRSREAQLKQRIDKQQNSYDKQIGDLKYHALQLKSDAKEDRQKQENALRQTNDSQKDAIQAAINTLQEQLGGIKQQLNAVSADPQLLADKETKHAQLQTILQDKQTAEQQANELEQEKQRSQTSINALLNAKQQRENQRDTLKQTLHRLNQQLKATPDTLLGFLREQQPNWVDDIAKVIQPNLLLREDLEPTLTASNHSLYGLQLNLTNVSADYTADEQQIRQRINDCHEQLEKLHDLDQKETTELDKLAKIQRDLIKQQQLAVASVTTCQNQLNKGKQELESLTRQIEQSKKQRQQAVKQQHSDVVEQITLQQQQLQATKIQLATQLNDLQTQLASAQQRIDEDSQQKIDSVQQAIKQLHQQQQQQLDDLAEQRLRSLQERKIDTTTLQALENNIARLKNAQQQAEKAADIVKDYQRWQTNEWVRYPEISAHISRCQTLQQQQNQHYESAKQNFATEQKKLETQQSTTRTALQTCLKQLDNINYLLKQLNDYALNNCHDAVLESAHTIAFLQNEYRELTEHYKNQRKELTQLINHLKRVLAQEIGTRPAQYYATQERALMDSTEENEWIIAIQNWYEEDLINYQRWLIAQTHNFGGGIHEYKQALEKFNRGVKSLSTRLAAHIDENILFEKIERIEVHLKSKVDTLDYWQQLEQFSQHYNEWQRLGNLPSSDFAKIIEQVASQLQGKGRVETKLVNLLELEIGIVENGRRKTATQADDLKRISSTGLSYLILCVIFIALVNMIRKQQAITIIWPMDELKDLHDCNIEVLLDLLTKNNIHVLSAFPSADPSLLALFANCYEIQGDRNLITFTIGDEYV